MPSHFRLGDVSRSDIEVRHHVQLGSTPSCYVKAAKVHMGAAKHLLRYLAGTTDFTIVYKKEVSNSLPSRIQTGVVIPTMASQLRVTS